jgi:hypothetical protein
MNLARFLRKFMNLALETVLESKRITNIRELS